MDVSDQVIGLIDYSKFNQTAFTTFAEISEIDFLITDGRIPESPKKRLAAIGLNVVIG
jgi:DeoR/GlpR family transcriptional regulator of sugar metabolism